MDGMDIDDGIGGAYPPPHHHHLFHQQQQLPFDHSQANDVPLSMLDPSLFPEGQAPVIHQQQPQGDVEIVDNDQRHDDNYEDDDDDAASDISGDSDAMELRAELEKFDQQQEAFIAKQTAEANGEVYIPPPPARKRAAAAAADGAAAKGGRKKPRKRIGPRQAVKPTPDIVYRLSLAKEAFEREDYEATIAGLSEIIRHNSEIFQAWTMLSAVHEMMGNREKAVWCKISAAHLKPREVQQWINTAEYALVGVEEMEDGTQEKTEALNQAYACYTQALETDRSNITARTGRADVIMMQGQSSKALREYQKALEYKPWNIRTVRNIADVALDVKNQRKGAEVAKGAYRRLIDHLMEVGSVEAEEGDFEWSDLRIYLEFFSTLEQWKVGLFELKEISRWLLGRREERYWDGWEVDDREWDFDDERRMAAPGFMPGRYPLDSYGQAMPVDLRAKMFVYRSKMGPEFDYEANMHLQQLDPDNVAAFMEFPDCIKDIVVSLFDRVDRINGDKSEIPEEAEHQAAEARGLVEVAHRFLSLYRHIAEINPDLLSLDADYLVCQGRYNMAMGDKFGAEECFIAAIEDEEDHIEARVQLAKMYEGEEEQEGREEAFLLVHEAMNLEARRATIMGLLPKRKRRPYGPRKGGPKKPRKPRDPNKPKKKYVPRRLINAEKRRQQELEMTAEAAKNFAMMKELEGAALLGDEQAKTGWMKAAKELVDDFRSYKQFYPWDKYIKFLGYVTDEGGQSAIPARNMKLRAMEERLRQNLAPAEGEDPKAIKIPVNIPQEHRGIPFPTWLDIFLNYAFSLVRQGQHREAYVVCHAARDSVVWTTIENTFLIHVAWASCAVYAGDEETCVAIARYFMRDYMPGTDSYRMFSAMCRVCQTPVSWYTSGPAQKFILRQIKTMDNIVMKTNSSEGEGGEKTPEIGLDVCLLTIYGHILFTTTSYTYALSYFARAASIDPNNCLINLSTGLAYIHYALKRQATNRQYLLTQGFAFLFRYYHDRLRDSKDSPAQRQEAHFNIARAYSLIGLGNLAVEYYKKVLEEPEYESVTGENGMMMGSEDLRVEAAYNIRSMCYLLGDVEGSRVVTDRWMVLE
ncbi:transcription factor tau subunit sfc4 [Podospora fimiseda]|uniref:Transcription factor tau subunit sfc4 n=1 Tax=Podospora fimiseda TaxID=252190 RepID=A0AAN7BJY5_9PEZI|nr:transcription factor tau subunit sfc4 [Podospora fimiseda]